MSKSSDAESSSALVSETEVSLCPYCGKPMRWTATRWMTRGLFECERCGDFPDYRGKPRTKISLNR